MNLFQKVVGICIHHSLTPDGETLDAKGIRHYHMSYAKDGVIISKELYEKLKAIGSTGLKEAWSECGYHWIIERVEGVVKVIEMRNSMYQGAHCPALNADHLGICIVGNFDLAAPDDEMLQAAADLCARLKEEYAMPPGWLKFHCDYSHKTCPGSQFPKTAFALAANGEERP